MIITINLLIKLFRMNQVFFRMQIELFRNGKYKIK